MPKCSECRMLVNNSCFAYNRSEEILGRKVPPPPLGACALPIVEDYLHFIKKDMRVLEIGCGSWNLIKNHCQKVGADYEGIDTEPEYFGIKTVATRLENLAKLSFPNEYFDVVIGNQTMEHWIENGCLLRWGLYQCFRVCKQNGRVLMNVPIHFHGSKQFMFGKLETIQKLFSAFSEQVYFEKWGDPSDPLPACFPFPGYKSLDNRPAYVLDIQAIKNIPIPTGYNNLGAISGRLSELLNYPVSFNVYRLVNKLRKKLGMAALSSYV